MVDLWKSPIPKFMLTLIAFFAVFYAMPPLSVLQTAIIGGLLGGCVSAIDLSIERKDTETTGEEAKA